MERNALEALASLLDRLGIRWMLIGALAANRYRVTTRLTQDVDLLLADVGPGLDTLERVLGEAGWLLRRALPGGEILRLRHAELGAADLIVAGTAYEQGALARARDERLGDAQEVRIAAPEDVIVLKLIAGRSQDVADIEAILAAKPSLDEAYVEEWVEFWGVRELWHRVRAS
jgi:predicted nucleotidyltransferase